MSHKSNSQTCFQHIYKTYQASFQNCHPASAQPLFIREVSSGFGSNFCAYETHEANHDVNNRTKIFLDIFKALVDLRF